MKKIGKYVVTGLLGKGGMGRVYKAVLPVVDKIVAIKLLVPHEHLLALMGEKNIESTFIKEAHTLAQIRHSNIACITDFDRDEQGRPFFVMEYLCMNLGIILGEHYQAEKTTRILPPYRALRYIHDVLQGLERLHHSSIIHRDIKPYNLLLSENDEVRIIDFGLSRLRKESIDLPENLKIGTPYYASPEQETDPEEADERADLYSTGVLAWRMLTGKLPSENHTDDRPSDINPILGRTFDEVLFKSIQKDPDKRYQNCKTMRDEFKLAYENWHQTMENACRLEDTDNVDKKKNLSFKIKSLRKFPKKIGMNRAVSEFGLDNLWRPFPPVAYVFDKISSEIIAEKTHGLRWQRSGSAYPLNHREAIAYIEELNLQGFGNIRSWRLPTVNELTTLINPISTIGEYCQPRLFDTGKIRFWSCDKKTHTAGWFIDAESGFVASQDLTCKFYVRAVSDSPI